MLVLNILCILLLSSHADSWVQPTGQLLTIAGLYFLFQKSGVKGWWAFVPVVRWHKLALCADREPEGRVLAVTSAISILGMLAMLFVDTEYGAGLLVAFIVLLNGLTRLVYMIRVLLGLIEVYNTSRWWIALWLFGLDPVVTLALGCLKQYQPQWKVQDIQNAAASFFSGVKAAVLDQGLTVNLEEQIGRAHV